MVTCTSSRLAPLVSRGAPSGALRPRPLTRAQRHRRCPARGVLGLGTGQEFDTFDACGFSVITNLVTPFWVLMVFAPNWKVTERVMESPWPVCLCALVHLALVWNGLQDPEAASRLEFFATQAVVKFSAMQEMREAPSFVSEEWAHVLVWDLFAGRYIFLDGKEKKVPTFHSLLGAFALGPVGLLAHQATIPLWHKLVEGRETRGESREEDR